MTRRMSIARCRVQSPSRNNKRSDMKLYLMRLALTWMQSAMEAKETAEKPLRLCP